MALRPPTRRPGLVNRGVLEDALKKQRQELETGSVQLPGKAVPSGTGFRHVTNGSEDAAAKLVDTADVNNDQITYAKIQNISATKRVLARKTASAGDVEECTISDILDFLTGAAQGDILFRGSAGWQLLPAGTGGNVLTTHGAGADPTWAAAGGGGGSSDRPSSTDAPSSESDLQLWLRADKTKGGGALMSDAVIGGTWFDLSTKYNDAWMAQITAQPTPTNMPIYKPTGGPNSQPAMFFPTGGNHIWQLPGFLDNSWTAFECFVIVKMTSNAPAGGSNGIPLGGWGTSASGDTFFSDGHWYDGTGQSTRYDTGDPAADMTQWRCLNYQITPSATNGWKLRIDNTLHFQTNSGAFAFGKSPAIGLNLANLVFTGTLAEVIAFSSLGHRANLLTYLNTRYSFTLT